MFDKLLGKKQKSPKSFFTIPQKKYQTDQKKLQKYDKKELLSEIGDMEKYITNLIQKLDGGHKEYDKVVEKNDQLSEKVAILNEEIARINNQHEQLGVKFTNLTDSLEVLIKEKENLLQKQREFVAEKSLMKQAKEIRNIQKILEIYRDQVARAQKIVHQNKNLKQKYSQLQSDYFQLTQKLAKNSVQPKVQQLTEDLLNDEVDNAHQQQQSLQISLSHKQQTILSLTHQLTIQKHQQSKLSDQIKNLNEQLSTFKDKLNQTAQKLQNSENEVKELRSLNNTLSAKIKELEGKSNKTYNQSIQLRGSNDLLANKVKELQKQMVQFKQLYENIKQEKIMVQEQKKLQAEELQNRLNETHNLAEQRRIKMENLQLKMEGYQNQLVNYSNYKQKFEVTTRQNDKMSEQINNLGIQLTKLEQQSAIKYKKLQFELNQEKIKHQSVKRSTKLLEERQKQNKSTLDQLYEKKMHADGKIGYLEVKLKEYKKIIQCLKKEKLEMEKTIEKIEGERSLGGKTEQMVLEDDDAQVTINKNFNSPKIVQIASYALEDSQGIKLKRHEEYQSQILNLRHKIINLQEQIMLLKHENLSICENKSDLTAECELLKKKVKQLSENRQELTKQIKRLNSQPQKPAIMPASNIQNLPNKQNKDQSLDKQRKVAQKAYKGFQILSKQLQQLYKDFLNTFITDIKKDEIKHLEGLINLLLSKTMDMKDVIQDYIVQ